MAHYETWFKLLWNACVEMADSIPEEAAPPDDATPWSGVLENMHAIADGERDMWLQVPDGHPILRQYVSTEIPPGEDPWPEGHPLHGR